MTAKTSGSAMHSKEFLLTPRLSQVIRDTFLPRFTWRSYILRL